MTCSHAPVAMLRQKPCLSAGQKRSYIRSLSATVIVHTCVPNRLKNSPQGKTWSRKVRFESWSIIISRGPSKRSPEALVSVRAVQAKPSLGVVLAQHAHSHRRETLGRSSGRYTRCEIAGADTHDPSLIFARHGEARSLKSYDWQCASLGAARDSSGQLATAHSDAR